MAGPPVTTHVPSGLNEASKTVPPWPLSTRIVSPVRAFQIRASPSTLAVTTRPPSRENSTESTSSRWPTSSHSAVEPHDRAVDRRARVARRLGRGRSGRRAQRAAAAGSPTCARSRPPRRRDPVARAGRWRPDRAVVPRKDRPRRAGVHLPRPRGPVPARCQHRVLVVAEAGAAHMVPCSESTASRSTRRALPRPVRRRRSTRRQAAGESVEADVVCAALTGPSNVRTRPAVALPDDRVAVRAGGRDPTAVRAEHGAVHRRRMRRAIASETVAVEHGSHRAARDDEAVRARVPRPR